MAFTLSNVNMTGNHPYYLRIDYRHKVGAPCIRVFRESYSLPFAPIDQEALSMTELKESPFILQALINPDLINIPTTGNMFPFTSLVMEIVQFIDTNTG